MQRNLIFQIPNVLSITQHDNVDNVGGQIDTENGRRIRQEVIETILALI
jgi:hypothetical protein